MFGRADAVCSVSFFFQAEDGIRDVAVTGVQTCALPISVQHFAELVGATRLQELQGKLAVTAVGPVTANALRKAGVERAVVAQDTTAVSVVEALEGHFAAAKAAPAGVKRA